MTYKTSLDLYDAVLAHSNENERNRINEEITLFKNRNWEDYVLFLANVLCDLKENNCLYLLNGSAQDCYMLHKCIELNKYSDGIIFYERGRAILFNDALRAFFTIVGNHEMIVENLVKLDKAFEKNLKESGLQYFQKVLEKDPSDSKELVIISKQIISDDDKNVVLNEERRSSEYDNDVLRSKLIVTINTHIGI